VLWGNSWALTWPSGGATERQEVATSALCEYGSGAPRRRALRTLLCIIIPKAKKQKEYGKLLHL
jgi:hypothetical protein